MEKFTWQDIELNIMHPSNMKNGLWQTRSTLKYVECVPNNCDFDEYFNVDAATMVQSSISTYMNMVTWTEQNRPW